MKNDNLKDFLTDVADAIREKEGSSEPINPQEFSDRIRAIQSGGGGNLYGYTGHADVEGLKAIGWTDADIDYYQQFVNWDEEYDEYHKVTDDNKALYGVLTANNIADYKDRIVYLPKIDLSGVTSMESMFAECFALVALPMLDTSNVTTMLNAFNKCYSLVSVPCLDTRKVKHMGNMYQYCYSLTSPPQLNMDAVTAASGMFFYCYSLKNVPQLNLSKVANLGSLFRYCYTLEYIPALDTSSATVTQGMVYQCYALKTIPMVDMAKVTNVNGMFTGTAALVHLYLKNLAISIDLSSARILSKESLIYMIQNSNESATAVTITLHPYAYERLTNDPDVFYELQFKLGITLASAE